MVVDSNFKTIDGESCLAKENPLSLCSFYSGKVKSFPLSRASVTICNNSTATGSIQLTPERSYVFYPLADSPKSTLQSIISEDGFHIHEVNIEKSTIDELQLLPTDLKRPLLPYRDRLQDMLSMSTLLPRAPFYGSQPQIKYIEIFLVNDYHRYLQFNKDLGDLEMNTLLILSEAQNLFDRAVFDGFRVKLVLAGMFTETDVERFLPENPEVVEASELLEAFCEWKSKRSAESQGRSCDNAQLLSSRTFHSPDHSKASKTIEGLSFVKGMCSHDSSCGIIRAPFFADPIVVAGVLAHEIGHNLDAVHDGIGNECSPFGNIMQAESACSLCTQVADSWSICSIAAIGSFLRSDESKCLDNPPDLCGNGILDAGEECDSGLDEGSECCTKLCKLRPGAKCEDRNGNCCKNCQLVAAGVQCKNQGEGIIANSAKSSCELPSYCTGDSPTCKANRKPNGSVCSVSGIPGFDDVQGICLEGACRSREVLCAQLGLVYSPECDPHLACSMVCYDSPDPMYSNSTFSRFNRPLSDSSEYSHRGRCVAVSIQQLSGLTGPLPVPDYLPCHINGDTKSPGFCHAGICSKDVGIIGDLSSNGVPSGNAVVLDKIAYYVFIVVILIILICV